MNQINPLRLLLASILLLLAACSEQQAPDTSQQEQSQPDHQALQEAVSAVMEQEIAAKRIAGGTALITIDGERVVADAWGWNNKEAGEPMAFSDLFRIASMTKIITTTALLQLHEQGLVGLNDPVKQYIPEFADPQVLTEMDPETGDYQTRPASRDITIHDLLTHTSGIAYPFTDETLARLYNEANIQGLGTTEPLKLEDTIVRLADLPLKHDPGEAFTYGYNLDVIGRVVEVVSGQSLADYFQEYIFKPLGLEDIGFYLPGREEDLTRLYTIPEKTLKPYPVDNDNGIHPDFPVKGAMTHYAGGGGLTSSTEDYHRFLTMLHQGGSLDGAQILKPESVKLMKTNQIGELDLNGSKFSYGLRITTPESVEGQGEHQRAEGQDPHLRPVGSLSWGGIFQSTYWIDPKNDMIVVLMTQVLPSPYQAEFYETFERAIYENL